ncbi:MAG: sigma-70 family RNA polymerase sigma factor [Planctomycetes bacterium]|nr:sigma-70 family RNA polymerase sigma factor [Planctomycetota bacterium]
MDDAVRRVQGGDTAAFEEILRRFERPLRAWLAACGPPGVDVDEVAQQTFVAAFLRLDEYRAGTEFGAWLFAIARFRLKTEATRLRRVADYHARYGIDLLRRELERRSHERPDLVEARLEHLKKCVDMLGEHLARYVSWRYEEEISLDEMASRTGRSVHAVKKQLWKIRRTLQECVEGRMAIEGESS